MMMMPAYSQGGGIFSSLTHRPTSGKLSTSKITLPMYRLAISVQTKEPCWLNRVGPVWMP